MAPQIRKITDPDEALVDKVSEWMYEWWGRLQGKEPEEVRLHMKNGFQRERFPQTYGLFVDDELVGIYRFRLDDMFVHPDIYPWLADVYIHKPFRGKGYSRILLESVKENAEKNLEFSEIYLFTEHIGLYEKYGWEFAGEIDTFARTDRMQRLYKMKLER